MTFTASGGVEVRRGLVLVQSLWMGLFVNTVVHFPGDLGRQLLLLVLVNAAMTATCLGISSVMKSADTFVELDPS